MLVLAPLSVAVLVAASWLVGGWRNATLEGADAARAYLAANDPDFDAPRVLLASDGRAALLASATGERVAAIIGLGDRLVIRKLPPGAIRAVHLHETPRGRTLRITTCDLTCRRIDLHLDATMEATEEATDLAAWMDLLRRLVQEPATIPAARHMEG